VVGGTARGVDLRVISATDTDLDAPGCNFRAALRHRLGACEIAVPALRDHPEDIPELLLHFLRTAAAAAQRTDLLPDSGSAARRIATWAGLFALCLRYDWPGNVRELANVAQRVLLYSGRELELTAELVGLLQRHTVVAAAATAPASPHGQAAPAPKGEAIDDAAFDRAMRDNDFAVQRVARHLGISRAAVYRRIAASPQFRLARDIPAGEMEQALAACGGDPDAAALQLQVSPAGLRERLRNRRRAAH